METERLETVENLAITVYPEIIAAASQKRELDLYIVWLVLREINAALWNANSVVDARYIRGALETILGISPRYAYQKFKAGIGIYWNRPAPWKQDPRRKVSGLAGMNRVVEHLNPELTRSRPVRLPIATFVAQEKGWRDLKALLVCLVVARNHGERPVPLAALCEATGLSRSTLKRLVRQCPCMEVTANLVEVATAANYDSAKGVMRRLAKAEGRVPRFRVLAAEDGYHILRQIANSYRMLEGERLSFKRRPRELRRTDKQVMVQCAPARYVVANKARRALMGGTYFTPAKALYLEDMGPVQLWKAHNLQIPQEILKPPAATRRSARYAWERRYVA